MRIEPEVGCNKLKPSEHDGGVRCSECYDWLRVLDVPGNFPRLDVRLNKPFAMVYAFSPDDIAVGRGHSWSRYRYDQEVPEALWCDHETLAAYLAFTADVMATPETYVR